MLVLLQPVCVMVSYLLDAQLLLPHLPHAKHSRCSIVSSASAGTSHIVWQPGGHSNRAVTHTISHFTVRFRSSDFTQQSYQPLSFPCVLYGLPILLSSVHNHPINTLRTGSFKLFKRPFSGFLTILTL